MIVREQAILERFDQFLEKYGDNAFLLVNQFLDEERKLFTREHHYENEVQARQGWVTTVGGVLEKIILKMLKKFCETRGIKVTSDKSLRNPSTIELERVRRNIEILFDRYSLLPDGDIILYYPASCEIIALLSIKNSFRERYTETPYWKLKLKASPVTQNVRVFMITPDRDGEIAFVNRGKGPRKARIVMEYELDGIYLAREEFDGSEKVKSIAELIPDLEKLLEENSGGKGL